MSKVYVNRTLNLKKIQYLGFDMDHTLVRYNAEAFERAAYQGMIKKLVQKKHYPKEIEKLPFDFNYMIRGLVLDKKNGNVLKLNRYSGIRLSYHGTRPIDFKVQKEFYKSIYIDLRDPNYYAVDTSFSISPVILFSQLVDLKDGRLATELPDYVKICDDIMESLDNAHRDGTLKEDVKKNLSNFLIQDERCVQGLEKFRQSGKAIFVLTNSHFDYTKVLLDYTINPFLKEYSDWSELFEFVITAAQKPRFFYEETPFLKIDKATGLMTEATDLKPGIYQGGDANSFSDALDLSGDEILYIGDHIYGDILKLKKSCNWRTGLVVEELDQEIKAFQSSKPIASRINELMTKKEPLERELIQVADTPNRNDQSKMAFDKTLEKITEIDGELSALIKEHQQFFNPNWGEIMRIGSEESYFASQMERYACVYMSRLSDLLDCSPRSYFRGFRRQQPHEI